MSEAGNELVSVVIPTRNRRARLACAIESVRQQTWPNIEIIVIDDASSDDTPLYLQGLQNTGMAIRVVRNELPQGGAGARNQGIDMARGTYVAFLDDDDIWLPNKLDLQITCLKQQPSASSVSCSFFVQQSSGGRTVTHLSPPADGQQLLHTNHLGGASMCLARRQMLLDIGAFDASLRSCQDWDLWIKLNDRGPVLVCPEPLVCYMPHDEARITSNPYSTYAGRRRIFLRYRMRMSPATRRHHLSELLYCRKLLLGRTFLGRTIGMLVIFDVAGARKGIRYLLRYLKNVVIS